MSGSGLRVERDVVRVEGPDAEAYLDGQVSQDVAALGVGTAAWTFVLGPDGKVESWGRLTRTRADAFACDVDAGAGARLEARLRRFLLRTRAEIGLETVACVSVRGSDVPRPELPGDVLRLPAIGPGVDGYDLLGDGAQLPAGVSEWTVPDAEAYRIRHGVPAFPGELGDHPIPAELGPWAIEECVNFAKGCYVGQELTARIDSRGGNVPRRLRVLTLDGPIAAGASVTGPDGSGVVTSVATTDGRTVALAFCGRKIEPGAVVDVDGVAGEVHDAPIG